MWKFISIESNKNKFNSKDLIFIEGFDSIIKLTVLNSNYHFKT